MMKWYYVLLILFIFSCKKDKINFIYPKEVKMKIQDFNEDSIDKFDTNLIYAGNEIDEITVNYFSEMIPAPPPPKLKTENEQEYQRRIQKLDDSLTAIQTPFFKKSNIKDCFTKDTSYIDSLNNYNLEIKVLLNDTIPLYKRVNKTNEIKKYKAFPIIIKNISTKTLKIPLYSYSVAIYIENSKELYQYTRNSNYNINYGCFSPSDYSYFELQPNGMLVYALPYFKRGKTRRGKISFYKATSQEFEISIDDSIIMQQRQIYYLE